MRALSYVFLVAVLCSTSAGLAQSEEDSYEEETESLDEDVDVVLLGLHSVEGDDEFASELTEALREQLGNLGGWHLSDRPVSLNQMSLAYSCDEIDALCLGEIAKGLKADRIIYGTIRRTSAKQEYSFSLTIGLFNAERGSIDSTLIEAIPIEDTTPGSLATRSQNLLYKMIGISSGTGSIAIYVDVPKSDVMVDSVSMGQTEDGHIQLDGIDAGEHQVQVSATGYSPRSQEINVLPGEKTTVTLGLAAMSGQTGVPVDPVDDEDEESDGLTELIVGWSLVGVSALSLTGTVISWVWINDIDNDQKFKDYRTRVRANVVNDVCEEADAGRAWAAPGEPGYDDFSDVQDMCNTADVLEVLQYVFLGTAIVSAGVGTYLLLSHYGVIGGFADNKKNKRLTPTLAIQPNVGRDYSGISATIQF